MHQQNFDEIVARLRSYLKVIEAEYPLAWEHFDLFRAVRGRGLPT